LGTGLAYVVTGDAGVRRNPCGQAAVGVTENQDAIRTIAVEDLANAGEQLADLCRRAVSADVQVFVRGSHAQFPEEHVAEVRVVVLPGVDEAVRAHLVEHRDDTAQPDDLGTGPDNRRYLHRRQARSSAGSCA